MKRLKTVSLFLCLIVAPVSLYAISFEFDPASFVDAWHRTNHWLGIGALTLMGSCLAALWKAPQIKNERRAKAFEFVMKGGTILAFMFFYMEFHWYFDAAAHNLIDLMGDIINGIIEIIKDVYGTFN